jgi:hypothetical protein
MSILDKASLIQIPSGYKSTKLYSLRPTNGDGDFTFARSSSATRVNADGLIEEVPYNLVQYSEDITNAVWGEFGASRSANTATAPNGTTTADTILPSATTETHGIFQQITTAGGVYSASAYFKANGYNYACIRIATNSDTTRYGVVISLIDGSVTATNSTGSPTNTSYSIETAGNGWFKLNVSCSHSSGFIYHTVGVSNVAVPTFVNSLPSFTANGTSGIYIWGAQLNSGSTAKPYFPTTDRLNVPRLDYSGGASCASLLLEGQRTNLVIYSESFDNVAWTKPEVSVQADVATSPDGTTNADLIKESNANALHWIGDAITVTSGNSYTISVFAKKKERSVLQINLSTNFLPSSHANYDLDNGLVSASSGNVTTKIDDYGNDWFRCQITFTATSSATGTPLFTLQNSTTASRSASYQGDGTSGLYLWGAQAELGSYATSYIPSNSGSQTTRSADVCNNAGTSATFNDSEGVLFAEIAALADDETNRTIGISDNVANNFVQIGFRSGASNTILAAVRSNGGSTNPLFEEPIGNILLYTKVALKYKENDICLYVNGLKLNSDTSNTMPTGLDRIGFDTATFSPFYGKTKQLMYFDEALSDEELSDLTGQVNLSFNNLAEFYNYTIL